MKIKVVRVGCIKNYVFHVEALWVVVSFPDVISFKQLTSMWKLTLTHCGTVAKSRVIDPVCSRCFPWM